MTIYTDNLGDMRLDSQSLVFLRSARTKRAEDVARERYQLNVQRLDAVSPGNGPMLARDLEFAYQEVLQTDYEQLSALRLIPRDSRVPAGATTYTIRRIDRQGDARYHRGNNADIPGNSISMEEEIRPVRHIVTSFSWDIFEQASATFANVNLRGELQTTARDSIQRFLNDKTMHGDDALDVYGVTNYPYLPKANSSVSFTGTPADVLKELHRLASLPSEISKGVFMPNTIAMPLRQANLIAQTKLSATDLSETIEEAFLKESRYIDRIEVMPELEGAGPNGEDLMFLFRANDQNSVANVIPQDFTMLPVQTHNFALSVPCYMSHGGVRMWKPLNNLLVRTPALG